MDRILLEFNNQNLMAIMCLFARAHACAFLSRKERKFQTVCPSISLS